jgi:hypothetical protein
MTLFKNPYILLLKIVVLNSNSSAVKYLNIADVPLEIKDWEALFHSHT